VPAVLRLLLRALAQLPQGFVEGILRVLAALWALLLRLLGKGPKPPKTPTDCFQIPPDVARKPDPCIYSQWYLAAKGMSVTWDNPDIQVVTTGGVPVPSHALVADTDYRVEATIHNASFDAALGVEVICVYRPWSFGTADRVPVEADALGNPAIRRLNIGSWGSAVATFKWHTPNVADAHFCIQVECHHVDDREPNNNLGQENTNVAKPASPVELDIPLFNPRDEPARILLTADAYEIPTESVELRLEELHAGAPDPSKPPPDPGPIERRAPPAALTHPDEGARIRLNPDLSRNRKSPRPKRGRRIYKVFGYPQRAELRAQNARGNFPLPPNWQFDVAGAHDEGDGPRVTVPGGGAPVLHVTLDRPPGPGVQPVNLNAYFEDGLLAGGVTVYVEE
jgi:hypothetical protein